MSGRRVALVVCALSLLIAAPGWAERVIIKCVRPCTPVVQAVEQAGGQVTYRYRYVDAVAADVPSDTLDQVRKVAGQAAVRKDFIVDVPTVPRDRNGGKLIVEATAASVQRLDSGALAKLAASPNAYLYSNTQMNVDPLLAAGYAGQGIKVAIIDSGIRPGFPHISLDGSVIGGEDFVGDGLGYSNFANGGHGTFVAGMISANVVFGFATTSALLKAVKAYCPACLSGANWIPMVGSAPLSSLYSLRVFGPTGGAPESRIIAAMERVIELRENFDSGGSETPGSSGKSNALNVAVCNMSLGGATLQAGRDIEDQLTNAFLDHDIVLVTSAGNAGPSGSTIGSPGTGFGTLTVGASSSPIHERILRDLQYGVGNGLRYRPFDAVQMAYFSSRGPSADGRPDIEVVANGFASYGMGFGETTSSISLASGTSFSSPSVAGVAAVLRQAVPAATARQVRNAIVATANPHVLADGSGPLDQGAGFVDAAAAAALLSSGTASDKPGAAGGVNTNVSVNILQGAGVKTFSGNVTRSAQALLPGQRFETYYRVTPNTAAVVVTLSNVQPGAVQNSLFGDDILLAVHSAKTSAIGEGDYNVFAFSTGGTFVVKNPEQGMMRITLSGDWTNASPIAATVNIFSVTDPIPGLTTQSKLNEGDTHVVPFVVPAGTKTLDVRLAWDGDWSSYPANDIDLILVDPFGAANFDGATISDPEHVVIENPAAGAWLAVVDGYSISTKNGDKYKLRIAVDGVVIR